MHGIAAEIEARLRQAISTQRLQRHLERFSTLLRDSGSLDERRATEYVAEEVGKAGAQVTILTFDSLISWPLEASLVVTYPDGRSEEIPARPRSFGGVTPPEGIAAELVLIPFQKPGQGEMIFTHRAIAGEYAGHDVRGKIVLTADGGPDGIRRAEERGALAHVHIWPSDEPAIHEMIATPVWGTPTPETAPTIPKIPALGITNADGERLARACATGPVRARLIAKVRTEWMRLPLVLADIPGRDQEGTFLLVGAHIDSWYEGITDNATGDASLIEMACVLAQHPGALHYGVRFAWWPGHSTGRYSGSTWYADTHFMELRERCLGYLNIDSPGIRGASVWDCRYNTAEVEHITAAVVRELSGQEPNLRRPLKAGDQSFLGVGVPSLGAFRMLPPDHPERKAVGGSGGGWWWHTPHDTLDKADAAILADDTRVYVTLVSRMCAPVLHPYRFAPVARDFLRHLGELQEAGGAHLDLMPVLDRARHFQAAGEALDQVTRDVQAETNIVPALNRGMRELSRVLNPVLFTLKGPYEFDPALQLPVLPGLAPVQRLVGLDPSSDDYRFLWTQLVRQRNRVEDALRRATALARDLATLGREI
jgi:hypothetical protein